MKAELTMHTLLSTLVSTWWTPVFVAMFFAVVLYALWPRNRETFDAAARLPLRED
jgi:cytochrome c oxidase cbb3-type subunit IV